MAIIIKPIVTEKMTGMGEKFNRYTKAGLIQGRAAKYKKALVTLKEGDTIDFYSNI